MKDGELLSVTCIYCLQDKPLGAYRHREHVMSRCFGTFRPDNLILREVVCDECNQYFGDNIELILGRDSMEGILRYRYGIKPKKAPKSHKRLKFRVEAGELKGLIVIPKYSGVPGDTDIEPALQVGFYRTGHQLPDYFEPQDIPTAKELKAQGYDISREQTIVLMARNEQEMKLLLKALKDKGMNVQPTKEMDWPEYVKTRNQTWTKGIITADQIVQRGFCKIAFNYLAYAQGPGLALHEDFNAVREFIRYGRGNVETWPLTIPAMSVRVIRPIVWRLPNPQLNLTISSMMRTATYESDSRVMTQRRTSLGVLVYLSGRHSLSVFTLQISSS